MNGGSESPETDPEEPEPVEPEPVEPGPEGPEPETGGSDSEEADVDRVRAERDAALAQRDAALAERDAVGAEVADLQTQRASRHLVRRTAAGVLVVISCLSFLTGGIGIWASRSLLDTNVWVDHVGPLIRNPEVQAALSTRITTETMQLIDPKKLFQQALPERGQVLAGPLSNAVETFVGDQVDKVVASQAFERLWIGLNRQAHSRAVKLLRGESNTVQTQNGTVTFDLVPIINQVLARLTAVSPELFGKTINIPNVQINEIPASAIAKINKAFGTNLPPDFGQITIYDQGKLKQVQDAISAFDTLVWVSVVVFVVSTLGALALSINRRRTLIELAVVDSLLLILMRRAVIAAQNQILNLVPAHSNRNAVKAVSDAILQGLFDGTRILLWAFGILILLVWVTGKSAWATSFRRHTMSLATGLASAARDRGTDPATTTWVVAHRDVLRIAGVVVAVVLLWWINMSWLWVLIVLLVLAGYEVLLSRMKEDQTSEQDSGTIQRSRSERDT